jgi:hypothetical protein
VIGRNGTGKSTLLKINASDEAGAIRPPGGREFPGRGDLPSGTRRRTSSKKFGGNGTCSEASACFGQWSREVRNWIREINR